MNDSIDPRFLNAMVTNTGEQISKLSNEQLVFLLFLRHFGCVFCKEALNDLSKQKEALEKKGIRLVFVHMSDDKVADKYFAQYGLEDVAHISDPECTFYAGFGITKGSFSQLYGLRTWIRGYQAKQAGHELELSKNLGDSTQMPGIFVVHKGEVVQSYIHKRASDRPDYEDLIAKASKASIPKN